MQPDAVWNIVVLKSTKWCSVLLHHYMGRVWQTHARCHQVPKDLWGIYEKTNPYIKEASNAPKRQTSFQTAFKNDECIITCFGDLWEIQGIPKNIRLAPLFFAQYNRSPQIPRPPLGAPGIKLLAPPGSSWLPLAPPGSPWHFLLYWAKNKGASRMFFWNALYFS